MEEAKNHSAILYTQSAYFNDHKTESARLLWGCNYKNNRL